MGSSDFVIVIFWCLIVTVPLLVCAGLLVNAVRNWSTITTLAGTCALTISPLVAAAGGMNDYYTGMAYVVVALLLGGAGFLTSCVGAFGVSAKYMALLKRAKDLEIILAQIQERMAGGPERPASKYDPSKEQ